MEAFLRLLEEASLVRVDGTGQYYLLDLRGLHLHR
jgi:hypothetical protein